MAQPAPLFRHRFGHAVKGPAALFPSVRAGRQEIHSRLSPLDNSRREKRGKAFQPKASCLGFPVPELPRLKDLIRPPDLAGYDRNRVFQCNPGNWRGQKEADEFKSFGLFRLFPEKPPPPRNGKVSARRVRNHDIPPGADHVANVAPIVRACHFGFLEIAGQGVMTTPPEGIPNLAGILTSHQNAKLPGRITFAGRSRFVAILKKGVSLAGARIT